MVTTVAEGGLSLDAASAVWGSLDTGETGVAVRLIGTKGLGGAVAIVGLADSTCSFEVSLDGSNYFALLDLSQTVITATSDGLFEFSSSAEWIRPVISGGTDTGVAVSLVYRG